MTLLIIILILSVSLNVALIFGIVSKNADEDMIKIRMNEGMDTQDPEHFGFHPHKVH